MSDYNILGIPRTSYTRYTSLPGFQDAFSPDIDGFTDAATSSSMWCLSCRKYFC